jgi:hypothetical protein
MGAPESRQLAQAVKRAIAVWGPQDGPQEALLTCPYEDIVYGGARGGGKTDGALGRWLYDQHEYGRYCTGAFFRREVVQLEETIERAKMIYLPYGARWQEQKKTFIMPNRSRLKFRYLERDVDADAYQGHSYTHVFKEELTNWATPKGLDKLRGTLRSPYGIRCVEVATCNPGGPGHQWVKARYITPAPMGYTVLPVYSDRTGKVIKNKRRVFIPAKVSDNKYLGEDYVENLHLVGNAALVKAWLDGDWDVVAGAFFDCWSSKMVLKPFTVPVHWTKFASFDWGSARPYSYGLWAIAQEDHRPHEGVVIPRGSMVRFLELYGLRSPEVPNEGTKEFVEQIADRIIRAEQGHNVVYRVADPGCWKQDGGPSHAERLYNYTPSWWPKAKPFTGLQFREADNTRLPGWDEMRQRMIGRNDLPLIYTFSTCMDSIRTIPVLQHDEHKPEDVDTDHEDHAGDDWRYACMSRPLPKQEPKKSTKPPYMSYDYLVVMDDEQRRVRR